MSRILASILISTALSSSALAAQDRPVVFVHGLMGSGVGWQPAADYLRSGWKIFDIRPTIGWTQTEENQAASLHAALGYTGVAAVSHSNGGIVTRQYARGFGASTRVNQHLAIGSLHRGAPLAANVRNGNVPLYGGWLANAVVEPFAFYDTEDPDFHFIIPPVLYDLFYFWYNLASVYAQGVAALGFPVPSIANPPVLAQMDPSSSLITALNSSSNLTAEAARFPQRVGIATAMSPEDIVARLWCGSGCREGRIALEYYALLMYTYYQDHPDLWLRSHAYLWERLFWAMYDFNVVWHYFIGSLISYDGFQAVVQAQDGILPWSTQTYINGTRQINIGDKEIMHFYQRVDPRVWQSIEDVFGANFGLVRRPPPPPLVATISGPSPIAAKGTYTWEAMPSGGVGGYTYQWSVHFYGTGQSLQLGTNKTQPMTVYQSDGDFDLTVVTGSGGQHITTTRYIENTIPGGTPPPPPPPPCPTVAVQSSSTVVGMIRCTP